MPPPPVRSSDNFLVFGAPQIGDAEIEEVIATMRSGWLGTGPRVKQFEEAMAEYRGSKHAIAVNSCTAALHLSMLAAGVGSGDEVITTPLTFCATVNAILHCGATPVLADIDPVTLNIDPARVSERVTSRTRAIMPVHFAGRMCEMQRLMDIAQKHDLVIIEDCAHAVESDLENKAAGTWGIAGCFSFYVTKNVATGEGGMILTNDDELADQLRVLSLHGMSKDAYMRFSSDGFKHYDVVRPGFKYNMMDLQAAIGIHQLARVEAAWRRRKAVWEAYNNILPKVGLTIPSDEQRNARHAYHLYTVLVDEHQHGLTRDQFLDKMTAQGIGLGIHYRSIPSYTYYREKLGWEDGDYPVAKRVGDSIVSLPITAGLSKQDVEDVVEAVTRVLRR